MGVVEGDRAHQDVYELMQHICENEGPKVRLPHFAHVDLSKYRPLCQRMDMPACACHPIPGALRSVLWSSDDPHNEVGIVRCAHTKSLKIPHQRQRHV